VLACGFVGAGPAGATCAGGSSFRPTTSQSVWSKSSQYFWQLVSCPAGHRMVVCRPSGASAVNPASGENEACAWDHASQQCEQCPEGKFVLNSSDYRSECRECPATATCEVRPPRPRPLSCLRLMPLRWRIKAPLPRMLSVFLCLARLQANSFIFALP